MTQQDKHDLAIAILLWRNFRLSTIRYSGRYPTPHDEETFDRADKLAEMIGVKPEFLDALFKTPVMSITIKELDSTPKKRKHPWKKQVLGDSDNTPTTS